MLSSSTSGPPTVPVSDTPPDSGTASTAAACCPTEGVAPPAATGRRSSIRAAGSPARRRRVGSSAVTALPASRPTRASTTSGPSSGTDASTRRRSHGACNSTGGAPACPWSCTSRNVAVSSNVAGPRPSVGTVTPPSPTGTVAMLTTCDGSAAGSTTATPPGASATSRPDESSAAPGATVTPGCPVVAVTVSPSATPQECKLDAVERASGSSPLSTSVRLSPWLVEPARTVPVATLKYWLRVIGVGFIGSPRPHAPRPTLP